MSSERQWACTKRQLVDALAHITVQPVTLPGREARVVVAGEMADAILAQLPEMPAGMVLVGREDLSSERRRLRDAEWQRRKYRLVAYGRWEAPFTAAAPARAHVAVLLAYGISGRRIAAEAGISAGALRNLMDGRGGRPPAAQVRPATEARLLAVMPTPALLDPGVLADATGTRRRLQALVTAGWTRTELAGRLGFWPENLARLIRGADRVKASTAQAVAALYDDLWDTPPDESAPRAAAGAARARRDGRRHGWPLPAAWDDDVIDDPDGQPAEGWERRDGGKLRSSAALVEDADFIIATQGCDRPTAAGRLGLASRHALDTAYLRVAARRAAGTDTEDPADEDVTDAA